MIIPYAGISPRVSDAKFIADNAVVIGRTTLRRGSSIWFGAVVRADEDEIRIGNYANVQDNVTIHADPGFPVKIGNHVTIGHNAVIHGAQIGDNSLIGMHATVLNGAKIGKGCLIGAGALVTEHCEIPDYSLAMGVPAKVVRRLGKEEAAQMHEAAAAYSKEANKYFEAR